MFWNSQFGRRGFWRVVKICDLLLLSLLFRLLMLSAMWDKLGRVHTLPIPSRLLSSLLDDLLLEPLGLVDDLADVGLWLWLCTLVPGFDFGGWGL